MYIYIYIFQSHNYNLFWGLYNYSNPGADRIRTSNEPQCIPYILSTSIYFRMAVCAASLRRAFETGLPQHTAKQTAFGFSFAVKAEGHL